VSPRLSPRLPDLGAIFDAHFDYVYARLRRLGVGEADLEDLAQEVFLRVHAKLAEYDAARPIRPWLFGFAYRVAAGHRGRAARREIACGSAEPADVWRHPDERLHADEEKQIVEAALGRVPLDRRVVLLMHDVDEVPVPAVARELGIPLNTAYSRLRIARAELGAAIGRLRKSRGVP
jgi:RNA polymerase sigma-70 factor (ECF subfamily)